MSLRRNRIKGVASLTSQGSRPGQEDRVLNVPEKGIFVVADGFGGVGPGSTAAKTACDSVRGFLVKEAGDLEATLPFILRSYISLAGNVLFNALVHANRKVLALNRGKGLNEKGGASVLAGFLDGDLLALANAGGCTAWLVREGRGVELVIPRTFGRLVDPFSRIRRTDLEVPLTAVGIAEDLEPEIFEYRVQEGDWLLLQTDGITDDFRTELTSVQARGLKPEAAIHEARQLFQLKQFDDNASISLIIF